MASEPKNSNTPETPEEKVNTEMQKSGIGEVHFQPIESEMEKSYLDYAMSVIVSRALPDVRDGLKPVHRRILYTMHQEGLRSNGRYRKSANTVGVVMARYHPHGDSAIYDSMARMAQDFSLRYLLVDGQGNFGSMDGDSPAAMRYTEARMTKLAEEMLADIDRDTVDFMPNYDGSQNEPKVLPAKLPNMLLMGVQGIAVGMATNIPTHNLTEVCNAVIELIDNPEATLADLMKHVKGPDFPTGAVIYDDGSIAQAYGTGKGSIVMRAIAEIEEADKGGGRIIVTEVPYQVNKSTLIEKMADLVRDKKIVGISDIRDESAKKDVRIVIELKRDAYPKKILNQLYKLTALQSTFHVNMLALVDGIQPRVLTLETVLREHIKHRQSVVRRRTEFELRKAQDRAHILEGLRIALDQIDEVVATIRASQSQEEASQNLIAKFKLSEIQAKAILQMPLRQLAGLERKKIEDEYDELQKLIKKLTTILSTDANILKVIREEVEGLRDQYGDERRTKIIKSALGKFSEEDLIPDEQVIITLTRGQYVKRAAIDTYRSQHRGGKGIMGMSTREEDVVEHVVQTSNHENVLFFTTRGRVFKIKTHEIPQGSRTSKGQAIVNFLNLSPDERITSINVLPTKSEGKYLFMATKSGVVKKTSIAEYQNIRNSGLIAIRLDDGDELRWVKMTSGEDDIIIATSQAQAIRFNERGVRPMGRPTRGVRGMKLKRDDQLVGMDVVNGHANLLVISENGYGKITKLKQFTAHARGGVGIRAGVVNAKTGKVVDVRVVGNLEGDIIIISRRGQVIRLNLKGITVIGRSTQGVRIMKMAANDQIASVALIFTDELKEITQPNSKDPKTPAPKSPPAK